jgi:hypothetical protein
VYHLKGQDTNEHLQKIGELMQRLLVELQPGYAQEPVYQMFERVFSEHFRVEEKVLKIKIDKELSANSLQSPDDLEVTYRQKNKSPFEDMWLILQKPAIQRIHCNLLPKFRWLPTTLMMLSYWWKPYPI